MSVAEALATMKEAEKVIGQLMERNDRLKREKNDLLHCLEDVTAELKAVWAGRGQVNENQWAVQAEQTITRAGGKL